MSSSASRAERAVRMATGVRMAKGDGVTDRTDGPRAAGSVVVVGVCGHSGARRVEWVGCELHVLDAAALCVCEFVCAG